MMDYAALHQCYSGPVLCIGRERLSLTLADYIALAAVVVSILSALYARWAANEARRANQIALHVHKVEIYEEVISFSDCFRGLFSIPTEERLEAYRKRAVTRAELYLSEKVYLQLKEIHEHCCTSQMWLYIAESEGPVEERPTELEVRREYKSVLDLLYPVIQKIKVEAKLNDA
jgi:hypothetical protein